MPDSISHGRRSLLLAAGLVAVAADSLFARAASASDKPKLDPGSERARGLDYTHDAASAEHEARKEGARCANCAHFKGEDGAQWASCNVFPEHLVNADGWCTSWYSAG